MQIIGADFVVLCDEGFSVIETGGICFNAKENPRSWALCRVVC